MLSRRWRGLALGRTGTGSAQERRFWAPPRQEEQGRGKGVGVWGRELGPLVPPPRVPWPDPAPLEFRWSGPPGSGSNSHDRTCPAGLVGSLGERQRLVACSSVRPFGPERSSMRVDCMIDHQICIRLATTRSQNWGKRAHLTHGACTKGPTWFRSLPPALCALDPTHKPARHRLLTSPGSRALNSPLKTPSSPP
jgi:hypothetical protein